MAHKEIPPADMNHIAYVKRKNAALSEMFSKRERAIAAGRVELWEDDRLFRELDARRGEHPED